MTVPLSAMAMARLAALALEAAAAPRPASLGLVLGDDEELAALNAQHMGVTGATDVLSFPLLPPATFMAHAGQQAAGPAEPPVTDFRLPPGRRLHLGDVVISVARAAEQAREGHGGQTSDVSWSLADELRLLIVHGTLHVCGWDHQLPAERLAMRALERRMLGLGLAAPD